MIWKEATLGLRIGMFGGDRLSRTVRFKFCRADDLQTKTRAERPGTDMKGGSFITYRRIYFSPELYTQKKWMGLSTKQGELITASISSRI